MHWSSGEWSKPCAEHLQDDEVPKDEAAPTEPPPSAPPPTPAGAPPPMPPPLDPLRGIAGADFARFDGELDSEMGRQFEVRFRFIKPTKSYVSISSLDTDPERDLMQRLC